MTETEEMTKARIAEKTAQKKKKKEEKENNKNKDQDFEDFKG